MANVINDSFKTDSQGNTLFCKWSLLGRAKAYVIPNATKEQDIRKFLVFFYKMFLPLLPLTFLVCALFNSLLPLLILIPILIWYEKKISSLIKGLSISNENFTINFKERYANYAQSQKKSKLWLLIISGTFLVLGGINVLITAKNLKEQILGASSVIFFGACLAVSIYMLRMKRL